MNAGTQVQYSVVHKQEKAHEDSIWSVAWRKCGTEDIIVSGGVDDLVKVWVWRADHLEMRSILEGHQLGVISVDINAEGTIAASSSLDSHIKLWDLERGRQLKDIETGPVDSWTLCFTADSRYVVSGSQSGAINLFSVENGRKESSLDARGKFLLSVASSADGKHLACGSSAGLVSVFDVTTGKVVGNLDAHAMPVRSLSFSPDSQLLVSASDDGTLKMFDFLHSTSAVGTLAGHASWVLGVTFSPDNTRLASAGADHHVKIWNSSSRQCEASFQDHSDQVWSVRYNSNGSKLVSASNDKALHVYECPMI